MFETGRERVKEEVGTREGEEWKAIKMDYKMNRQLDI